MKVTLNGKKYTIEYTVNSLCEIEEYAGMPIDRLMARQFSATRLLLWGGLRKNHGDMTIYQVGDLIWAMIQEGRGLEDVVDICAEGLREAGFLDTIIPKNEEKGGAEE